MVKNRIRELTQILLALSFVGVLLQAISVYQIQLKHSSPFLSKEIIKYVAKPHYYIISFFCVPLIYSILSLALKKYNKVLTIIFFVITALLFLGEKYITQLFFSDSALDINII